MAKEIVSMLEGELESEKNQLAEKIRESIVDALVSQNPIPLATGRLASSIEVVATDDGFEVYAEDWWKWVENGRKRGAFPPILPIMEWMKAKGIKPKTPNMKPEALAFVIARSLSSQAVGSTNPRVKKKQPSISPARPFLQQGLDAVADKAIDKMFTLIEEATDKVFK